MPYDNIPAPLALTLSAIFWLILLWMIFDQEIKAAWSDFFSMRRHNRRERNRLRAMQHAEKTGEDFWVGEPQHPASIRHHITTR